ncbi:beta-lactamase [Mycolicibacterium gilvum]|uniref:Beta-lactamase n=2 Tax=Mycolicibacterium gilvum TaxID=1804 RepID=A0A378SY56_9MYCO|nr:hypothetical protein [Mycolicibacterium gilvum]STZ46347.1 beta-lactamase [Mycolicibacterium gilvum]
MAIATMAAACAALLLSGCTAQVSGMPPDSQIPPQAPVTQVPEAPPAHPALTFDGLDARVKQAAAQAAESGAELTAAVLDRDTGGFVSVGAGRPFPIASVVKLFIADDVLLRESRGEMELSAADRDSLGVMLRSSDDSAAQTFWDRSGGNAVIARTVSRYGLGGTTAPSNGRWDVTLSTSGDLVRYYDMLLDGAGGLPPEQTEFIVGNLARSTPTGTDGYPQRFGIPDGLRGEPVAVKQGWFCCWNGGNQLHVSTGVVGADRRYVVALSSLDPSGEAAARQNMTRAVETMFPGGSI